MNLKANNICWVILAGGRASRMGGNDKGLILLDDKPLIEIVYQALTPQTNSIYINANRNLACYEKYAPVIQDQIPDFQGPLAGIESCLSQIDHKWIGFAPCDSPNIPEDLISRLSQHCSDEVDVIVAYDGKFPQPVFSLWNRNSHNKLSEFLKRGDRKMKMLLNECNTVYADFSDIPETFINLNTPEELSRFGTDND